MPILVTCKCGQKLRVHEKHAGKQTTCAKCGQLLAVAGPQISAFDVFVSYSSKDKTTCDALCAMFERKGLRCWVAPRDILPGMNWGEAIIGGIEQNRAMVLVFSAHSNESPQVKREVERAVSKGIPVIPLRIEDVKLSRAMEYFISSQHWLDALTPPLEKRQEELARKVLRLLAEDGSIGSLPSWIGPGPIPAAIPVPDLRQAVPSPVSPRHSISAPSQQQNSDAEPRRRSNDFLGRESRFRSWWSRAPLLWRWIAVATGAVALLALLIFNLLIPDSSGTIKIDFSDPPTGVTVKIDGEAIDAARLAVPLRLKVGEHRFEVADKEVEQESRSFAVAAGENPALQVKLVSKPRAAETASNNAAMPVPANQGVAASQNQKPSPTAAPTIVPLDTKSSEAPWIDLFNGKYLTGWTPFASEGGWSVKDKILSTTAGKGSLLTNREFADFELDLEFRVSKDANTGIFLRVPANSEPSGSGLLEIQMQDDIATSQSSGSDTERTGAVFHIIPTSQKANARPGNWNRISIRAIGAHILVAANGQKVLDASLDDYAQQTQTKPDVRRPSGRIGLQHRLGDSVEFRNIRIRELSADESAIDVDRRAAEWVQSVKGFVEIQVPGQQSLRRAGAGQALPSQEFHVVKVNVYLNPNTNNAGKANLKGLKAITGLNLGGAANLNRQGLLNAGIAEMQTLQDLGINAIGVDGTILEQVGKLTKLKSWWLDGLHIGDGSLQHLKELKALTILSLWGTSVNDEELKQLHGMTNLKTIRLGNANNVSADGIKALQSALPNCKVEQ